MTDSGEDRGAAQRASTDGDALWSGRPLASRRRRSRLRKISYALVAPVLRILVRALWWSYRVDVVAAPDSARELLESDRPMLPCVWHQKLLLALPFLLEASRPGRPWSLLISPSVDGDLVERVVSPWGIHVVRGSATRTGGKAIRALYHAIRREHVAPLILPDGPQGPPHEAKAGAIMLSQLAGVSVLPFGCSARFGFHLGSWDRLFVPLPFSRVRVALGEPLDVPRDLPSGEIEPSAAALSRRLDAAESAAG